MIKMKKILAVVLSLAMILTFMPAISLTAFADGDVAQIGGTGYASLAAAIAAAEDGDTITLLKSTEIGSTVRLDKDGTYVIDADGYTISMADGASFGADGAICFGPMGGSYSASKNITLRNATITGFDSEVFRIEGVNVAFDNCVFTENNITKDAGRGRHVIRIAFSNVTLSNCVFTNNTVAVYGVFYVDESVVNVSANNCLFKDNTVNGISVFYATNNDSADFTNCSFISNTVNASNNGAIVYGDTVSCTGCLFKGNVINYTTASGYDNRVRVAGAIFTWAEGSNPGTISGNAFVNNSVVKQNANFLTCYAKAIYSGGYYNPQDLAGNYFGGSAPVIGQADITTSNNDIYVEYSNKEVTASTYASSYELRSQSLGTGNYGVTVTLYAAPVTYVAQIGNQGYESLADAIAAAEAGDVIEMLADDDVSLTSGGEIEINKSLTINGNEFTVYGTANQTGTNDIFISGSGDVTINDLYVEGFGCNAATNMSHAPIYVSSYYTGKLTLNSVSISQFNRTGIKLLGGTFEINDCIIDCDRDLYNNNIYTKGMEIKGGASGTITGTLICNVSNTAASNIFCGIEAYGCGEVTLEDCTILENDDAQKAASWTCGFATGTDASSKLTVIDCEVIADIICTTYTPAAEESITIESGSYQGDFFEEEIGIVITGGTFDVDPSEYVADGYEAVDNGDGTWTVQAVVNYVAQIGNAKYESLAEAIAAAQDGVKTTITMIADETMDLNATLTVAATKNIVLDLNGHTVTGSANTKEFYFLTNNGTLEITDTSAGANGKITASTSNPDSGYSKENVTIYNLGGTLTLTAGTVENTTAGYRLSYAINNSSNAWGESVISTFNMTGGTVSAPQGDAALRVYQNTGVNWKVYSKNYVNISGGIIPDNGIFVDTVLYTKNQNVEGLTADDITKSCVIDTEINISGGTINGLIDLKIRHPFSTKLNITGGDFTNAKMRVRKWVSEYGVDTSAGTLAEPTEPIVKISGGRFGFVDAASMFNVSTAWTAVNSWSTYTTPFEVTGGKFNIEPSFVAEGYAAVANTDDDSATYGYKIGTAVTYVAQIGDDKYESLADAIAAAQAGDTIVMIADEDLAAQVTIEKSLTLDLNGKTISNSSSSTASIRINNSSVQVTITDSSVGGEGKIISETVTAIVLVNGATVTLESGTIEARASSKNSNNGPYALYIAGSTGVVNVTGGSVVGYGYGAFPTGTSTLNVSGGSITATKNTGYAILTNGSTGQNATININGGAIGGTAGAPEIGIYMPSGSLSVTGGTIAGQTAIYFKSSSLNITGGSITATGAAADYTYSGNGCYSTGDAIVIEACNYPGGAPNATITGATITSANGAQIGYYVYGESAEGTVKAGSAYTLNTNTEKVWIANTGNDAAAYAYVIGEATYVAQIGDDKYETLAAAIAAATDGDTVTLLADVTDATMGTKGIVINGSNTITLDLNGFDIVCTNGTAASNRMITIKGTTTLNVINSSNDLSVMDVLGNNDPVANTSTSTTLPYGVFRAEVGTTLNITGTNGNIKLVNGRAWGLNIKVLGANAAITGVIIDSQYGGGIEVTEDELGGKTTTGYAVLTDCTFTQTGYYDHCSTAVSVSGGSELVVNSGTYTSDNYAIYVFSSGGYVTVNGGTFVGLGTVRGYAFIAAIDTNTYAGYEGGLVFKAGNFSGNFSITDPATAVITGGKFSTDPSAYVASGYKAAAISEDPYFFQVGYVEATATQVGEAADNEVTYTVGADVKDNDSNSTLESNTEQQVTVTGTTDEGEKAYNTVETTDAATEAVGAAALDKIASGAMAGVVASAVEAAGTQAADVNSIKVVLVGEKTEDNTEAETPTVTYEVHPEAIAYVNDAAVGSTVIENGQLAEGQTFTFRLAVPDTIKAAATNGYVKVTHKSSDSEYGTDVGMYEIKGTAGSYYVEVTVDHFSEFELEPVVVAEIVGTAKVAATLSLGESIDIVFYISELSDPDATNYTVEYSFAGGATITKTLGTDVSANSQGQYRIVVAECIAKQMSDTVRVVLKHNGATIYTVEEYSIVKYCNKKIKANNNQKLVALCKAVLDYGASAQEFFNYNTDNLANATYSDIETVNGLTIPKNWSASSTGVKSYVGLDSVSATLSTTSQTQLYFYLTPTSLYTVNDYVISVRDVTLDSDAEIAVEDMEDGRILVVVKGIAARYLGDMYELSVTCGNETYTLRYSPMTYAYKKQSVEDNEKLNTLVKAMYQYYVKADAFFN